MNDEKNSLGVLHAHGVALAMSKFMTGWKVFEVFEEKNFEEVRK